MSRTRIVPRVGAVALPELEPGDTVRRPEEQGAVQVREPPRHAVGVTRVDVLHAPRAERRAVRAPQLASRGPGPRPRRTEIAHRGEVIRVAGVLGAARCRPRCRRTARADRRCPGRRGAVRRTPAAAWPRSCGSPGSLDVPSGVPSVLHRDDFPTSGSNVMVKNSVSPTVASPPAP